jgi:uncharacterized membrane protein YgcG
MTERAVKKRASKRELRVWAWLAGGMAFLAPLAVLGASPKPPADAAAGTGDRPVLIVRKITRRVIVRDRPSPAPVRYVVAPSSSSSSSSGGTVAAGSSNGSSGGGGSSTTPPTTTTGGS